MFTERTDERRMLRLILGNDDRVAPTCCASHRATDLGENVRSRRIEDLLRGIQAQPVEVKFVDPVTGVADEFSPSKLSALPHSVALLLI